MRRAVRRLFLIRLLVRIFWGLDLGNMLGGFIISHRQLNVHLAFSPGRFFVTPVLKAVLSYLILNYEMRTEEEGVRPENEHVAQYIIPNTTAKVFFRKRQ